MGRRRSDEVIFHSDYVSISELVRITGVRYSTIKYYSEEGMIPFEQEGTNLTRRYPRVEAVQRLDEIAELRRTGHVIAKVKEILGCDANEP
jgi:DNA-binding transcriptional MerR regulator